MPANTPEEIPEGKLANGRAEIRAALEPIFATGPKIENEVVGKLEGDGLALTRPGIRHHRPRLLPTRLLACHTVEVQDAGLPADPTGYR